MHVTLREKNGATLKKKKKGEIQDNKSGWIVMIKLNPPLQHFLLLKA